MYNCFLDFCFPNYIKVQVKNFHLEKKRTEQALSVPNFAGQKLQGVN